jgi:serine/threonine-protein kinase
MRALEKRAADRPQSAGEMLAGLEAAVTPSGASAPNLPGIQQRGGPGRRAVIAGAVAAIAAAIVAGTLFATRAQATGRIDTIGVMPIEDISGRDSIFVAAMHDAVTIALSRPRTVGVVPRSAMMRYKGSSKTTREIAKENDLDAVVEATVFRAGDVMRINVQLTDPLTSRALWSDTYERNVNNVLAAQTEVAEKIASGVGATVKAPLP